MLNDSRGQIISTELVLIVGIMLVLVFAFAPVISHSIEQNQALTSAKMGFLKASNDIAYNDTGNTFKFTNMTFDSATNTITISAFREHPFKYPREKNYINQATSNYVQNATGKYYNIQINYY